MIVLGSTCAKLCHQLLAPRFVTCLTRNRYIDKAIQKAFISKIKGTIEHTQIRSEIIQHSKANRRTLHTIFLNLEDAFGRELSMIGLDYRGIAEEIQRYIEQLYNNISGKVVTKGWISEEFSFKNDVYQGDPLSPIVFLVTFNLILDKLQL